MIPAVKPYFRRRSDPRHFLALAQSHYDRHPKAVRPPSTSWTVPALCDAYNWPRKAIGRGVIAIVELGGGWNVTDVAMAFGAMGQPVPSITDVSVDGTTNSPGNDADGEVALDIQVAGGSFFCATGVMAKIRVYWGQDIANCVLAAARDGCDVCSISWGAAEIEWGAAELDRMEAAAAAATASGMVVLAASGDNDAYDSTNQVAVDCPACCPHVIGCGGTSKPAGLGVETVWNNTPGVASGEGTGGGYSAHFSTQLWQIGVPPASDGRGRMVPDVAGDADPSTGYDIVINGRVGIIGGTSAVAPLWAGLIAAAGTKLGWITPKLYLHNDNFTNITLGDNGVYDASATVDPCTGLGSPIGAEIVAMLTVHAAPLATQP